MEAVERRGPALVLGAIAVLVAVFVFGALFDLGPFADDELSAAEFIGRGDQICKEAHDAFLELQSVEPQTAREAADLADRLASIAAGEGEEIAELTPPAALAAPVEDYLEARERGVEALEAGAGAAREGDGERYREEKRELAASQSERARLARAIGFSECSKPLRPPAGRS